MEDFEKTIQDFQNLIDIKEDSENLKSYLEKVESLKELVDDAFEKNKNVEESMNNINIAYIFRDELGFISEDISNNLIPVSKTVDIIIRKYVPESDSHAVDFPKIMKEKIGRIQKGISKINNTITDKAIQSIVFTEVNEKIFPKITKLLGDQVATLQGITKNLDEKISAFEGKSKEFMDGLKEKIETSISSSSELKDLRDKLLEKEKELEEKNKYIEKLEKGQEGLREEIEKRVRAKLNDKILRLELELKDLLQYLEKSPKYQLLFLINNMESASLSKIKESLVFDDSVIKVLIDDLKEQKLIDVTEQDGEIQLKIMQQLNPLSCLEFKTSTEDERLVKFQEIFYSPSCEENIDEIMATIKDLSQDDKERAGYLVALLYTRMQEVGKLHLLGKISGLMKELKPNSFYLRLVDNIFNGVPPELNKRIILEGLQKLPEFKLYSKDYKPLKDMSEDFPKEPPFHVNKILNLSLLDWEDEMVFEKTDTNHFKEVPKLVTWAWLQGKSNKLKIFIGDSKGEEYQVIASTSDLIVADLFKNEFELGAE
ncbi:MAG: hypothetical protein ACFFCS_07900 [Candidatus Hodarchaeota archaeon]